MITALSKSHRTITLRFPDIELHHTWNIDDLPWSAFAHPSKKKYYYDLVTSLDPELIASMQPHLADISPGMPEETRKIHQATASCFLYIFLSLANPTFPGCIYAFRSTLPIGAGLGSSASISVCLAAALLLQIRTLSGPHPDQPFEEARLQIERINRWAFVGEMCIHGNPSGVDNTVASQGKAVVFKRGDYTKPPVVTPLWNFPKLPLLLVDTKQSRNTKVEVSKVAQLKESHPEITNVILDGMDKISEGALTLIQAEDFNPTEIQDLHKLGQLMNMNHGLLVSLGVSHPRLERAKQLVDHEGLGWTKLTGAGGGGCSISLLNPDAPKEKLKKLDEILKSEGYDQFQTTLGGDGVGVLWPAVLKSAVDDVEEEEEEGGVEIDQENFLNAVGNDGVERLVGVHGKSGEREGWKFWRVEG